MERIIEKALREFAEARSKLLTLLGVLVAIFAFGTIAYWVVGGGTLANAFLFTVETFAFLLHDQEGAMRIVQLLLLIFGAVFLWFAVWTSLDIAMEGHFRKYFMEARKMGSIRKLKNHYVICGGGRVGTHIADLLAKQKKQFVLVEQKDEHVANARRRGFHIIDGDAIDESSLKEAGIERARAIISVLPETEKNVLVVLTAKELNPKIEVYARSNKEEYIKKLRKAGADYIFMPEYACAEEIVGKIGGKK